MKLSRTLAICLMACCSNAMAQIDIASAKQYVEEKARAIIYGSTRRVTESGPYQGTYFVQPCDYSTYEGGCWVRDYYYGCLTGIIPPEEIKQVYLWYKSHIDTDGANAYQVPDVILKTGRPLWVGDRPALDGNPFMVMLAVLYYDMTADREFITAEMPYLYTLMEHADKKDGLAYNSDKPNRVGFGFEDSVHMTGHLAYCSVLYYDASLRAQRVCDALSLNAYPFRKIADGVKASFLKTFWDGKYLKASTGLCSGQFDILAACYAVSCGLVDSKKTAKAIVDRVYSYNDELQVNGFYKYVPQEYYFTPDQVWESGNQPEYHGTDFYQWGGFWSIGTPHILHAIMKVKGKSYIEPMITSMIAYVRENGYFEECRNKAGNWRKALYYVQTTGAVSACLRMWNGEPWVY